MRPITVTVGPLISATATKVATAQRNYGTNAALALIGAATSVAATSVCASQSPAAAAFTINGTQAVSGIAYLQNQYIYITCGGDSHTHTVTVVGLDINSAMQTEVITLTNAQSSASVNRYTRIISITPSGSVTGTITVGSYTTSVLDTPREILITTTADETANTAIITGTDWANDPISETIALVLNTTVASVLSYKTVNSVIISAAAAGNISVGTNGVASSPWVRVDEWSMSQISIQATASGTVNYTIQQTLDDPNSATNPVAPALVTWVNSSDLNAVAATGTIQSNYAYPPRYSRVLLNSGTGKVTATYIQASSVTY